MENNEFIGRPKDFHYLEGSEAINFRKTFDLNGTQNDEMLRLYLRKAGLSDEIECLTVEQRRAFIYDIIKSNKTPGYWLPSTMQNSNYNTQRPKMQPPPPPVNFSESPSFYEVRRNVPESSTRNYGTMRTSVSAGSLHNLGNSSPVLTQRFIPAPSTPPAPSTFVTSSKGVQYEISGPMNFQHTAGDMTRDMTRNAFDLTPSNNDNVLRKYMMERGITDDDIEGMRKTDLIRKIVQSKFSWLPKKKKHTAGKKSPAIDQRINYATISGYPDNRKSITILRPAPSPNPQTGAATPTTPTPKTDFSNFTLVTSRFADPNRFAPADELFGYNGQPTSNTGIIKLPPLPVGAQLPDPPPRKSQYSSASLPTIKKNVPPPPLVIAAQANASNVIYQTTDLDYDYSETHPQNLTPKSANEPTYSYIRDSRPPPPTPPKPNVTKSIPSPPAVNTRNIPPPPPPMKAKGNIPPPPPMVNREYIPPPPPMVNRDYVPPPPPMKNKGNVQTPPAIPNKGNVPPPPPMVNREYIPPPPPMANKGYIPPPPPMVNREYIPPPPPMVNRGNVPPPMAGMGNNPSSLSNGSQSVASKNSTAVKTNGLVPPPPAPPMAGPSIVSLAPTSQQPNAKSSTENNNEDSRDAFLESIRKGVTLKKVDKKAATISGVKTRSEPRRPQITDFLTELKMGVTSRRMKNPEDNPFKANAENNEWND